MKTTYALAINHPIDGLALALSSSELASAAAALFLVASVCVCVCLCLSTSGRLSRRSLGSLAGRKLERSLARISVDRIGSDQFSWAKFGLDLGAARTIEIGSESTSESGSTLAGD